MRTQNLKKANDPVMDFEDKNNMAKSVGEKYFSYTCRETEMSSKMWQLK